MLSLHHVHQCYCWSVLISVVATTSMVLLQHQCFYYNVNVHQCYCQNVLISVGPAMLVVLVQHQFFCSNISVINGVATKL
jgi:hypothetical protein